MSDPRITIVNAWRVEESHSRKTAAIKLPHVTFAKPVTLAEVLEQDSEFGGTSIERLADGAAHRLGFHFDAAQYYIPLMAFGPYTIVDRVIFHPPTAVYLDGIQHDIREDNKQKDLLQKNELESMNWIVVRLKWDRMLRDPLGEIRKVLYGLSDT